MQVETGLDGWRGSRTRRFARHAVEMTAAMMLGMVVLGMAFRGIHLRCSAPASTRRGTVTPSSPSSR